MYTACSSPAPHTLPTPTPSWLPTKQSGNTSSSLCFSFTCSQSTFASVVRHLDLIRMTAEQSQPLAPGSSGVGSVPDSQSVAQPSCPCIPLDTPLGLSLPSWNVGDGTRWSCGDWEGPCPVSPNRNCCPWITCTWEIAHKPASPWAPFFVTDARSGRVLAQENVI